jgi:SsrA-binding protein
MAKTSTESPIKIVSENRKARANFHILETLETGIVLTGAEIKSVRGGGLSLNESFVRPFKNELFLVSAHIKPYSHSANQDYDPIRFRKLLVKRIEIDRLSAEIERKGATIVPLKAYFKGSYLKLEIAVAKGKSAPDKRDTIKTREAERDMARAIKRR